MAPHADRDDNEETIVRLPAPERPPFSASPPRILIIGGGNRGIVYSKAIKKSTNGVIVGVVEPIAVKRRHIGRRYIWGSGEPAEGQEFETWTEYVRWEKERRARAAAGEAGVPEGVDAVFICVQDQLHRQAVLDLKPLDLHIMCEKPLAPNLDDCLDIYRALLPESSQTPSKLFSIGHVLRYSPHNMLLRKLLVEDKVIGEVQAVNHTEPVGWNHFTHSYVRGNWRKESTSAPSLLAKSCHDIDLLYWLLAAGPTGSSKPAHVPKDISSSGSLQHFKQSRKPAEAGSATNCMSCAFEPSCQFSAKRIYTSPQLKSENQDRWARIACPEMEECIAEGGPAAGQAALLATLSEDYDASATPAAEVSSRNWFGRCVYEADNDVCDNQTVTLTWDDDPVGEATGPAALAGRGSKTATLHMVAFTRKICQRLTHIYGADGEITADSSSITVEDFRTGGRQVFYPYVPKGGGHGDADEGLARQFVLAVDKVKNHGWDVARAQKEYMGCSLEDVIMSHSMVFAAEDARKGRAVVDFPKWWEGNVVGRL
ncbi:hypothetical protein KVR01_004203 [Diaporthe batatas]|uniref:uncharacterized protein n=1 Tax=Diaporthe batatas TaxID=748121 RepID=UPI001D048B70|nr:uncharacterized protein KVR01_004203 [Diaporthe batatas]KAG8165651.1 hypothetical protein KVR01_004203 [Diaporthe batatas]